MKRREMSETHPLPSGFRTVGHACGIKHDPGRLDLALFVSDQPCVAAGVFTTNRVVGAPVTVDRSRVPRDSARAVVINSGNANACTGERGLADACRMTELLAQEIECAADDVLVCSTGVIGHFLPMEKLAEGIPAASARLSADEEAFAAAARAMMTTDTVPKRASRQLEISGARVTVSGAAKGAAMIAPNMATMLAVVMTDAAVPSSDAGQMLCAAVNESFNCISVDGHMSTSDTVLLLANGAAGVAVGDAEGRQALQRAIDEVCAVLAQMIIRDAEGAGHFVTINVEGLDSDDTRKVARAVAESALVKTAIAGNDPNWGRIVSAAGYSGAIFEESECSLAINDVVIYEAGAPAEYSEEQVSGLMQTGEVRIDLQFTRGTGSIRYWTCDLTQEYVRLNADYTT
jgi:glutamate N-acetyltransferase / amino-acid N-acetyltransferase